jgi:acetyl-CoA carboxylase carboxyl transferase subunit alpha
MPKKKIKKEIERLRKKIRELKENMSSLGGKDIEPIITDLNKKIDVLDVTDSRRPIDVVNLARNQKRPTTNDFIKLMVRGFLELHGDRRFSDDKAIIGGIGFIDNIPVTIIGHQKGRNVNENIRRHFGMAHPEGYRKALRLMEEAERFKRPIINLIDTPGAYPGIGAEERGQAEAIARNIYKMSGLRTPIISIVTGEGGSGGALALGVADRVFMLSNSIYSVISPEGCAAILWKDAARSDEAAESLKLVPEDLLKYGVIDEIIEEPGDGAHTDHEEIASRVKETIVRTLEQLMNLKPDILLDERYNKYRNMGIFLEETEKDLGIT